MVAYPTEVWPSTAVIDTLNGTTHQATGLPYIAKGVKPSSSPTLQQQIDRLFQRLFDNVAALSECRVVKTDTLELGAFPSHYRLDGVDYYFEGAAEWTGDGVTDLSDGDGTYYIWLEDDEALSIADSVSGWPVDLAYIPLAEVAVASGAITAITDVRNRARYAVIHSFCKRMATRAQGAVYFSGRPADDELLTINGRKYEMDADADFPQAAGDVQVDLSGNANVDDDITDIAGAINGDSSATVTAIADTTNDILWLYAKTAGAAGNSLTLVTALTNTTVSGATLADGQDEAVAAVVPIRHTITAAEATAGFLRFDSGLTSIENVQITFEDAGNEVASQVDVTISGGVVTLSENGVAWAADDVINLLVIGTE